MDNPNNSEEGRARNKAAWEKLKSQAYQKLDALAKLDTTKCQHEWIPPDAGLRVCKFFRMVDVTNPIDTAR